MLTQLICSWEVPERTLRLIAAAASQDGGAGMLMNIFVRQLSSQLDFDLTRPAEIATEAEPNDSIRTGLVSALELTLHEHLIPGIGL